MHPLARVAPALAALVLAGCLGAPAGPGAQAPGPGGAAGPSWALLAEGPVERTEAGAAAVGDRLYVVGGLFPGAGAGEGVVSVYDPGNGTWTEGPPLPAQVHHAAVLALGTRLVVLGGYAGPTFTPTAASWQLDTARPGAAWEPFAPLPAPRGAFAAATDGERIWIFGGVGGPVGLFVPGELVLEPSAWRLDDTSNPTATWTRIADLPDPRDHLAGAWLDGKAYAVGGRDLGLDSNTARLDVYDPEADAWSEGPPMPTPRGGLGAAAVRGLLVAVGGEEPGQAIAAVEAFDPAAGSWAALPDLPEPRHGVGVTALGPDLYVATGGPEPGFTYSATNQRLRWG